MQHYKQGFKLIVAANTIEQLTEEDGLVFTRLFCYQAKAAVAGKLTDNVGDVFLGIQGAGDRITPDKLSPGDPALVYQLLAGEPPMKLKSIIIQGANVGDGVFFYFS